MNWFLYILSSICLSSLLALSFKNYRYEISIFIMVLILTPARVNIAEDTYAPSLFTFLFNVLLQQDLSTRVLRPLFLSIPICLIILILNRLIRRKLF